MKEKEMGSRSGGNRLRREIWIHPDGGRRVHRTTSTAQHSDSSNQSEEDELAAMSELEVSILNSAHVQSENIEMKLYLINCGQNNEIV